MPHRYNSYGTQNAITRRKQIILCKLDLTGLEELIQVRHYSMALWLPSFISFAKRDKKMSRNQKQRIIFFFFLKKGSPKATTSSINKRAKRREVD